MVIYLCVPWSRQLAAWQCTSWSTFLGELRRCTVTCRANRATVHFDNGPHRLALAQDDDRALLDDKRQRREPTILDQII
jgi:hypothetical protein